MPSKLEKALRRQDRDKLDKKTELAGTMGVVLNGVTTVEVPNRAGFVYVLLNTKEQELIQAFNDKVSGLFGLAVIVVWNVNRYEVLRKDDLRYGTFNSNYLPKHGNQHSFNPDGGGGGDVTFIYGKQFVPLSLTPSGTFGAPVAIVAPYSQLNSGWHYIPSTPTPNITAHKPTDNQARMVLVAMDWNTRTPQLIIGTGTFAANLTGSADVIPYLPSPTGVMQIPIAGVRLVSGTSAVTWQNIYDVRQFFHPIFTGTSSGGGGGGATGTAAFAVFGNNASPNDSVTNGSTVSPLTLGTTFVNDSNVCSLSGNTLTFNQAGWFRIHISMWVQTLTTFGNGKLIAYVDSSSAQSNIIPEFDYLTAADSAKSDVYFDFDGTLEVVQGDTVAIGFTNQAGVTVFASVFEVNIESMGGGGGSVTVNRNAANGVVGWDEGVYLGTGTVLNFVGAGVTTTLSGTVFNINVPGGGGAGIVAWDNGILKGTGTIIDFRSGLSASVSGTVITVDDNIGWVNVKDYGATGDGATNDTASISAAVAILNASYGGVLYFPPGDYLTTGGFTISKNCTIMGAGQSRYDDASSTYISRILCNSATAVLFTVNADHCSFENLTLVNTAASPPSAGAGISVSSSNVLQRVDYESIYVYGFYINIDIQVGIAWEMHNSTSHSPVKYGVKIRNTVDADAGDWCISDCVIAESVYNADAAIRIESSGGGKIVNTKINCGNTFKFIDGISLAPTGATSILLVSNCSIENVSGDGIDVSTASASYGYIIINGVQFGLYSNSTGNAIKMSSPSLGQLDSIVISDCVFAAGTASCAISLTNVDRVHIVGNVNKSFGSLLCQTNCTNVVTDSSISILDEGAYQGNVEALNFVGAGVTATVVGSTGTITIPGGGGVSSQGIVAQDDGVYFASGTVLSFDNNLYLGLSGTIIHVSSPVTTYFRVGVPMQLSGNFYRVPDGVYASGSLGVFNNGLALLIGTDYTEQLWVSGTYQYLSNRTGTHLVHYGVPCIPQTQPPTGTGGAAFDLQDSDSVLLNDSDDIQLSDSDG